MAKSVELPKELQGYLEHPGGPKCHKKFKLVKVSFCEGKMNTLTGQVPKVSIFISVNGFGQVTQALRVDASGCGTEGGGPLQLNNLTLPGSLLPEVTPNVASTMADIWQTFHL